MLHRWIPVCLLHNKTLQRLTYRYQQVIPCDIQGMSSYILYKSTHNTIPIWHQHIIEISHPGHHTCTMVSICILESQLCYQSFQIIYNLWTFYIKYPSKYPFWTSYPRGEILKKIQCSYRGKISILCNTPALISCMILTFSQSMIIYHNHQPSKVSIT